VIENRKTNGEAFKEYAQKSIRTNNRFDRLTILMRDQLQLWIDVKHFSKKI
jgi:hypothetical protein